MQQQPRVHFQTTNIFWVRTFFLFFMLSAIVFCEIDFVITCLKEEKFVLLFMMILFMIIETILLFRVLLPMIEKEEQVYIQI